MNKLEPVNSISPSSEMTYKNKLVKEAYTEELLFELIERISMKPAPWKKQLAGDWKEGVVGIGNDHTASVLIFAEDKEALCNMIVELNKKENYREQ